MFGGCLLPFSSALSSYALPIRVQINISNKNSLSLRSSLCGYGTQYPHPNKKKKHGSNMAANKTVKTILICS